MAGLSNGFGQLEELTRVTRQVALRWRIARAKMVLGRSAIATAGLSIVWAALAYFSPGSVKFYLGAVVAAGIGVLFATGLAWCRRIKQNEIYHAIDNRLNLPDAALSLAELVASSSAHPAWVAQLQSRVTRQLRSQHWEQLWPAPWPKWTGHSFLACAVMLPLLGYLYQVEKRASQTGPATELHQRRRTHALNELFKDWEETQKETQDKGLKELLEKIKPLREKLTAPNTDQKQLFAELNKLEDVVAAERAKLEAESLEPAAAKIAAALEPIEGLSAMAAALRSGDFERAEPQARKTAEKLAASDAKMPAGAKQTSDTAGKLGQELTNSGHQKMGNALSQFSKGARDENLQKMSAGMKEMADALAQQNARDSERKRLSTQLAQVGLFKKGLAEGQFASMGMQGMPKLSRQPGGNGAGTSASTNPYGAPTQLAANHNLQTVNGSLSDGESETTTTKSREGQHEAIRATKTASFQEYEKLSQQAIEDENIPLANRQVIKRYFEKIRPETGQ